MKITAQIKRTHQRGDGAFEQKFRGAMSSKVALLNRITYYIVNRKGKQMRPMFIFFGSKNAFGRQGNRAYLSRGFGDRAYSHSYISTR